MSIAETGVIDIWGVPSCGNTVELIIADHLDWEPSSEAAHLLLLQEKINTYISFIESGEINTSIPAAAGKKPVIRVVGQHTLSRLAEAFAKQVEAVLRDAGIEFDFVLKQS